MKVLLSAVICVVLAFIVFMVWLEVKFPAPLPLPLSDDLSDPPEVVLYTCPWCGAIFHDAQHWLHGRAPTGTQRCIECFRLVTYEQMVKGLPEEEVAT